MKEKERKDKLSRKGIEKLKHKNLYCCINVQKQKESKKKFVKTGDKCTHENLWKCIIIIL